MFSRFGAADSAFALQHLSAIRPEIVIPPLLEVIACCLSLNFCDFAKLRLSVHMYFV